MRSELIRFILNKYVSNFESNSLQNQPLLNLYVEVLLTPRCSKLNFNHSFRLPEKIYLSQTSQCSVSNDICINLFFSPHADETKYVSKCHAIIKFQLRLHLDKEGKGLLLLQDLYNVSCASINIWLSRSALPQGDSNFRLTFYFWFLKKKWTRQNKLLNNRNRLCYSSCDLYANQKKNSSLYIQNESEVVYLSFRLNIHLIVSCLREHDRPHLAGMHASPLWSTATWTIFLFILCTLARNGVAFELRIPCSHSELKYLHEMFVIRCCFII